MPQDPNITSVYGLPLQEDGQLSRIRLNQAVRMTDSAIASVAGAVATLGLQILRVVDHPPQTMAGGELTVVLADPIREGSALEVVSGGFPHHEPEHYQLEADRVTLTFVAERAAGELVTVREFQVGPAGGPAPAPPPGELLEERGEVPLGTKDSTNGLDGNGVFTLAHNIAPGTVPTVRVAGVFVLEPYINFTWAGNQLFITSQKPASYESLEADYQWRYV